MSKHVRRALLAAVCGCSMLALAGCPLFSQPPFDANGDYEGVWENIETIGAKQAPCSLTLSLVQAPDIPGINFMVAGLVTFNWECVVPQPIRDLVTFDLPDVTVPVFGEMDENGHLTLQLELSDDAIPDELLTLLGIDVTTLNIPDIAFTLDGDGQDADEDGAMDHYAGTITLEITTNGGGVEGITADFAVDRAEPVAL